MTKIFISAPFFSEEQTKKVKLVERALAANPTVDEVVSPRFDQSGSGYKQGTYGWADAVYRRDLTGVQWCDAAIEILDFDNADSDSGTSFEMGFAKAIGKPTYTISFDKRPVNLMLGVGSTYDFKDVNEIKHHDFYRPVSGNFIGGMR